MSFDFEKFIKDICKREEVSKNRIKDLHESEQEEELPQRRYNKLYKERWQNRIKYRR